MKSHTLVKESETGSLKEADSNDWFQSTSESRSAYREGIPAGNKGAGISFRLVKD